MKTLKCHGVRSLGMMLAMVTLAAVMLWPETRYASGNATAADEQMVYSVHADKLPAVQPGSVVLIGHHYVLSLNPETKLADWCAYRVTSHEAAGRNQLSRAWLTGLREKTLEPDDYSGSGYDMGHLAPLASFSSSPYAYELNFVANIAPQRPDLNRGPWLRLESHVRDLAKQNRHVDVVAGPAYLQAEPPLPGADEPHRVPSHYFAITRPAGGDAVCYLMPQTAHRQDAIDRFLIDEESLTSKTGLTY